MKKSIVAIVALFLYKVQNSNFLHFQKSKNLIVKFYYENLCINFFLFFFYAYFFNSKLYYQTFLIFENRFFFI